MGHNHEPGGLHEATPMTLDTSVDDDIARAQLLPRFDAMRRAHDASPHVDWPMRKRQLEALQAMLQQAVLCQKPPRPQRAGKSRTGKNEL